MDQTYLHPSPAVATIRTLNTQHIKWIESCFLFNFSLLIYIPFTQLCLRRKISRNSELKGKQKFFIYFFFWGEQAFFRENDFKLSSRWHQFIHRRETLPGAFIWLWHFLEFFLCFSLFIQEKNVVKNKFHRKRYPRISTSRHVLSALFFIYNFVMRNDKMEKLK